MADTIDSGTDRISPLVFARSGQPVPDARVGGGSGVAVVASKLSVPCATVIVVRPALLIRPPRPADWPS
jgi:hypothetical protein